MTVNSVVEIAVDAIQTSSNRYRKDYGDIAGLAASIEQLGLLQPIGVNATNELVFGQRRLLAFQRLGRSTIPARVIDVPAIVLAEHAENEIRKDFTVSERVEIGKAVEEELKAIGERRGRPKQESETQGELVEQEISEKFNEFPQGRTAEIAATKAGFGNENTYRQAKTVVEKAEPGLVEAMDQGAIAVSTAAKLATAPKPIQQQAVAHPKQAVELAKAASATKGKEIQQAAKAIEQDQQATFMKELRERQPPSPPPTPREPPPVDPVFETILPNGRKIANGDPKALWLWGWLLECEDRFLGAAPEPETLAGNFLDFMQEDSQRLIPQVTRYLNQLLKVLHEPVA